MFAVASELFVSWALVQAANNIMGADCCVFTLGPYAEIESFVSAAIYKRICGFAFVMCPPRGTFLYYICSTLVLREQI